MKREHILATPGLGPKQDGGRTGSLPPARSSKEGARGAWPARRHVGQTRRPRGRAKRADRGSRALQPAPRPRLTGSFLRLPSWLILSCVVWAVCALRAAPQFDVFLGYDLVVPEATWFPVVCEIKNDGPTFSGTVELTAGNYNSGQTRRATVELPTGTLKRFVIPVFSTTRGYSSWDARLLDERGKVRAEQLNLRPRKQIASITPLLGSIPRSPGGTPVFQPIRPQNSEFQPASARLLPAIFPANPLVLEGMDALYLSSEKAPELKLDQIKALLAWLYGGGHLIVGVEQVGDVTGTAWLQGLFPCDLKSMQPLRQHPELQAWLKSSTWRSNVTPSSGIVPPSYVRRSGSKRSGRPPSAIPSPAPESTTSAPGSPFTDLAEDATFENAEILVAVGSLRDGRVDVAAGEKPLIVTANRGRGQITALLFSPEREPFRSWASLPTLWAKLAEVPGLWYASAEFNQQSGYSSDGIFGAMLDSKQVHKLPIGWLLVLLIVYLVVIGPLDQFWLKRIGRPMLTWITFPCYVVLFSFVIYFIGYKLRAGESEWNELHVVDLIQNEDHAELRGRSYASVYSPANQRYLLESRQKFATLRGEFAGMWGGGASSEKANVLQIGDSFKAEIFVPVWTSQLFVNDWWQSASMPLDVSVTAQGDSWQVQIENHTERDLSEARFAVGDWLISLGQVPSNATKTFKVSKDQATSLRNFVSRQAGGFQSAVQSRQRAFGETERISDLPNSSIAASFLSQIGGQQNWMNNFVSPPGLDMSPVLDHGTAIVFAWAPDFSPIQPVYRFSPRRSHRDTLWRVPVEIKAAKPVISAKPEA